MARFKVGDIVLINKRCKPHHLQGTKVNVGDTGVVLGLDSYVTRDGKVRSDPRVRFFSGEIHWCYSYFLSKVKVEK